MTKKQILLTLVLADFVAFTAYCVWDQGMSTVLAEVFGGLWTTQLAVDFLLSLGAIAFWIHGDAKSRGANPWPWVALTLGTDSIGWLVYLIARPSEERLSAPTLRATMPA